jgi:hypothetical protein
VLDAVRAHGPVQQFAVEAPTLSELFLAAAGRSAAEAEEADQAERAEPAPGARR